MYRRDSVDDDSPGHGLTVLKVEDDEASGDSQERSQGSSRLKFSTPRLRRRSESAEEDLDYVPSRPAPVRRVVTSGWIRSRNSVDCMFHPNLWEEYHFLRDEIWQLRGVQGLYTATNSKGGVGKTPLMVYLAALRADINRGHLVLVIDTNENSGSTAYRLGIDRSTTILLPEFLSDLGTYGEAAQLSPRLGYHRETGLGVLPNREVIKQDDHARRGKLELGLITARKVANEVFCDPGNGLEHFCNVVPARMADVLLLPGLAGDEESFDRIRSDTTYYREKDSELRRTIDRSFVVVLGDVDKKKEAYAERVGWEPERVFMIPLDRYMAKRAANNISIARLRLRTKVALARLLLQMLKHERNMYIHQLSGSNPDSTDFVGSGAF